ncbi:MAG TPA: DUF1566 domain-containing protein [Polyangia bacterium]
MKGRSKWRRLAGTIALGLSLVFALAVRAEPGAPAGRYQVTADTVFDTTTRLTWQRALIWRNTGYSYPEAWHYCAGLDLEGGGWRLPTVKELQTIVDERAHDPAIDPAAFPGTLPGTACWSSSGNVAQGTPLWPWLVDFTDGHAFTDGGVVGASMRCVR